MATLPPSYWRLFETNENMGRKLSEKVGGAGSDACDDLKKPLDEIFKEWRKEWKRLGLVPKRKSRL
jgi:hypothetical protein